MFRPFKIVRYVLFSIYRNFYYLYHYLRISWLENQKTSDYSKYYQNGELSNYDWYYILGGYDEKQIFNLYYKSKLIKINHLLNKQKNKKILDVGCGNGDLLAYLKHNNYELFGIDISTQAIQEAQKTTKAKLYCFDSSQKKLPFKKNSLDLVTAFDVVEHMGTTKLFFSEVNRILKTGGYFYIQTPNGVQTYDHDKTHINLHNQNYWSATLRKHNFKIIEDTKYNMFLPTPYLIIQKIIYFINYLLGIKIEQVVIIGQKLK